MNSTTVCSMLKGMRPSAPAVTTFNLQGIDTPLKAEEALLTPAQRSAVEATADTQASKSSGVVLTPSLVATLSPGRETQWVYQ